MARMSLTLKLEVVRQLHEIHERDDVDDEHLIQLQHDVDELLSMAAHLLGREP